MTIKEKLEQAIADFPVIEDDPRQLFKEAAEEITRLKDALHICIHGEPDLLLYEWQQVRKIYENT
ncbi:hypothetical protein [Endozoicomonas sp. Mp262]|uniref:hypothetical protein n=1 Tax=Endozoicomonas sp. Mp262 TaxID=2919499 RepID=UPI0021D8725F